MATLTVDQERLALSRLYSRFGFGVKPGEFQEALKVGFEESKKKVLYRPNQDEINGDLAALTMDDVGPRPKPGTFESTAYSIKVQAQIKEMKLWWLDQMATTEYPLNEKMTWFWHGHWATSVEKINFALPMYKQNLTFRKMH